MLVAMTWTLLFAVTFVAVVSSALAAGLVLAFGTGRRSPTPGAESSEPMQELAAHREELRHQFDRVSDLVLGLSDRQATQHGEVSAALAESRRIASRLHDTTTSLREALANPKARGQWGERMADDVLRLAGFVEGINYRRQMTIPGGTVPDFTFMLPGDLFLNMDVKFPLDNYLRALDAATVAERRSADAAFVRDVRQRVKEIADRGYVQRGVTVDHVLLFVPNEAVYGFIHQHDPELADLALRQRVVLCSPFTLFAVLGVIRQAVEAHELTRASDDILVRLASFEDQWQRFSDQLDVVAKRFDLAHRGLEELTTTRRRQLDRELAHVDDLRSAHAAESGGPLSPRALNPVDRAG